MTNQTRAGPKEIVMAIVLGVGMILFGAGAFYGFIYFVGETIESAAIRDELYQRCRSETGAFSEPKWCNDDKIFR